MALSALLQRYLIPCVKIPDDLKYIPKYFYSFTCSNQVISIDEVVTLQVENYDFCFVYINFQIR